MYDRCHMINTRRRREERNSCHQIAGEERIENIALNFNKKTLKFILLLTSLSPNILLQTYQTQKLHILLCSRVNSFFLFYTTHRALDIHFLLCNRATYNYMCIYSQLVIRRGEANVWHIIHDQDVTTEVEETVIAIGLQCILTRPQTVV